MTELVRKMWPSTTPCSFNRLQYELISTPKPDRQMEQSVCIESNSSDPLIDESSAYENCSNCRVIHFALLMNHTTFQ